VGLFGSDQAVGIAFEGKDAVTPVVREIRKGLDNFKRDAIKGFGLQAGFNAFNALQTGIGFVVDVMGGAVDAASDLQEAQAKVNVVFGDGADEVHAWAETTATGMGIVRREALEAAGTFGNFIQALGFAQDESQQMSLRLVELAADLASFNNTSVDEVLIALRSGLAGETEPMMRFGVDLRVARLEADLLANGIVETKSEITKAMKITAAYDAILKDTHMAQGDVARSADNYAMQQKILNAQLQTFNEDLGKAIVPVMTAITSTITKEVIPALAELGDLIGSFDQGFARKLQVADAFDRISESTGIQSAALGDLREKWNMYAISGKNWTASTDDLTVAIMHAERAALALLAPVVQHPAKLRAVGVAADDTAVDVDELNAAMSALADGGIAEVRSGAKAAQKEIRDLLHGGDEQKSVKALRAELRQLERQKRRAANQGRVEAFAAITAREEEIVTILRQRGVSKAAIREFLAGERRRRRGLGETEGAVDDVTAAVDAIPTDVGININVIGEDQVAAAVRMVSNLVAMSGNVVSVFLQGIGGKDGDRAHGGEVSSRGTYLVGERGPELLHMGAGSGRITPNHRMGGGGGNVYLDGRKVGFILDEELGRRYGMAGAAGSYRRAD
jgi:hypothetical protein